MSSTQDRLKAHREHTRAPQMVAQDLFEDGTRKQLIVEGYENRVLHVTEEGVDVLFESADEDAAVRVYDAFDGRFRPWHGAYQPQGLQSDRQAVTVPVYAAADTAEGCILGFMDSLGLPLDLESVSVLDNGDNDEYQWGLSFRDAANGTSFKAAGRFVPGGAVLTWWK